MADRLTSEGGGEFAVVFEDNARKKSKLCKEILEELPDWFGREEANRWYAAEAAKLPTMVARASRRAIGFVTLKSHGPDTVEILVMGVRPDWHGGGVGRALIEAAAERARSDGARYLSVKTLGPSHPAESYHATRAFYRTVGFVALEELPDFFGEGVPCLFLVKHLD